MRWEGPFPVSGYKEQQWGLDAASSCNGSGGRRINRNTKLIAQRG
jgi:hypothetical protein